MTDILSPPDTCARHEANLLILGKIRDSEAFARDLHVYEEWLRRGSIRRIVFSGWLSDLEPHRDIIRDLQSIGEVVLTPDPTFIVTGYAFHQIKNLYYGLQPFGDNDLVLKSRTDKIEIGFDIDAVIARWREASLPTAGPFSRRVMVIVTLALLPFFHNDMLFAGLARDIRKLCSSDLWFEHEHAVLNTEQIIHSAPYAAADEAVRAFFRVNPGLLHSGPEDAATLLDVLLHDPLYQSALYRSLHSLTTSYTMSFFPLGGPPSPYADDLTLQSLVAAARTQEFEGLRYHSVAESIEVTHESIIPMLLDLPISKRERRSLREIGAPIDSADRPTAEAAADLLAGKLAFALPGRPNFAQPIYREPGLRVVRPRPSNVSAIQ